MFDNALLGKAISLGTVIPSPMGMAASLANATYSLISRQANANMVMLAVGNYNVEEDEEKTESLLNGKVNMLGNASEECERNNINLIPDALALCVCVYRISDNGKGAYHTKSHKGQDKNGWIWLEDYLKYSDKYSYIPKKFDLFLKNIRGLRYIDEDGIWSTGLVSGVFFQLVSNGTLRIAYVTKGTSKPKDWVHNIKQGFDGKSALYELSNDVAKAIEAKIGQYINGEGHLYFFGHSLGGGMANYNAMKLNKPSVTFNAASVHPDSVIENISNYKSLVESKSMIGIYVKGEVLSNPELPSLSGKVELSNIFGLPKNGNRYPVAPKEYFKKGDIIDLHSLEPLCKQWGLESMDWNKRGNNTI